MVSTEEKLNLKSREEGRCYTNITLERKRKHCRNLFSDGNGRDDRECSLGWRVFASRTAEDEAEGRRCWLGVLLFLLAAERGHDDDLACLLRADEKTRAMDLNR